MQKGSICACISGLHSSWAYAERDSRVYQPDEDAARSGERDASAKTRPGVLTLGLC